MMLPDRCGLGARCHNRALSFCMNASEKETRSVVL